MPVTFTYAVHIMSSNKFLILHIIDIPSTQHRNPKQEPSHILLLI